MRAVSIALSVTEDEIKGKISFGGSSAATDGRCIFSHIAEFYGFKDKEIAESFNRDRTIVAKYRNRFREDMKSITLRTRVLFSSKVRACFAKLHEVAKDPELQDEWISFEFKNVSLESGQVGVTLAELKAKGWMRTEDILKAIDEVDKLDQAWQFAENLRDRLNVPRETIAG